jgi:MFS family permease
MEFSMWNGEFPLLFNAESLGLIMLWAGVGEAVGGLSMGWLSDRIGHSLTWLIGTGLFSFSFIGMYLIGDKVPAAIGIKWNDVSLFGYLCAFCFGLADAIVNTQIYALLGNLYKIERTDEELIVLAEHGVIDDSDMRVVAAFTAFNFFQNCGAAIGFFYQPLVPSLGALDGEGNPISGTSNIQLWVEAGLLITSAILFITCDRGWVEHWWCRSMTPVIREPDSIRSRILSVSPDVDAIMSPVFVPRSKSSTRTLSSGFAFSSTHSSVSQKSPGYFASGSFSEANSPVI